MIINVPCIAGDKRGKRGTFFFFLASLPLAPLTPATQAIVNAEFGRIYLENENRTLSAGLLHPGF